MMDCRNCGQPLNPQWNVCPNCRCDLANISSVSSVNVQDGVISGDVTINNVIQANTEKSSCRICLKYGQFTIYTCFSCMEQQCENCTIVHQHGITCTSCSSKNYHMLQQALQQNLHTHRLEQQQKQRLEKQRIQKTRKRVMLFIALWFVTILIMYIFLI